MYSSILRSSQTGVRSILIACSFFLLLTCPNGGFGQTFPLNLQQDDVNYNHSSQGGLPDGPDLDVTLGAPKAHHLRTAVTFSHVLKRTDDDSSFPNDADPNDSSDVARVVLRRAAIGAPYIARASSFLIGAVITRPEEDEAGGALPEGVSAEDYWFAEPDDSGNADNKFYWSPHAASVFAVEAGSVSVVWVKREAYDGIPDDADDTAKWLRSPPEGDTYFRKYEKSYIVSGSAIKDPQKIYWNTAPYAGPIVELPGSRVGAVQFVYSDGVPEEVEYETDSDNDGVIEDTDGDGIEDDEVDSRLSKNSDSFTRTIWLETLGQISQIRAQNVEGRIFMEVLGDIVTNDEESDVREHLGFEIIDILKYPAADDSTVELGTNIVSLTGSSDLYPVPVDPATSSAFFYQQSIDGVEIPSLYATQETENANDLLIHWMVAGVEGIRWPSEFVRYQLLWPDDVSKYSHYVRPAVATDDEAMASAVRLNAQDVPFIEYQDIIDEPRARLTEDSRFYTRLDSTVPAHRTLLRFNSGDDVAFERVFSWLDTSLLSLSEVVHTNLSTDASAELSFVSVANHGATDSDGVDFVLNSPYQVVAADGIAYVLGSASDSLSVIDYREDPAKPNILRTIVNSAATPDTYDSTGIPLDNGFHLNLVDGYLYVSLQSSDAVAVFDTAKLIDPDTYTDAETMVAKMVNGDPLGSSQLDHVKSTAVYGDYLYIVGPADELVIFNIANLATTGPVFVDDIASLSNDTITDATFNGADRITISDGIAYVSVEKDSVGPNAVMVLDVATDPANPALLARIVDGDTGFENLHAIEGMLAEGGLLYIAGDQDDAVTIVDVGYGEGTPSSPVKLAELNHGDDYPLESPYRMAVKDGILFVPAGASDAVSVFDVTTPSSPVFIQSIGKADSGDLTQLDRPFSVSVDGNLIYVSAQISDAVTVFEYPEVYTTNLVSAEAAFAGSVAADLSSFNDAGEFEWYDSQMIPRVVMETVEVGKRILAPEGELGADSDEDYLAGYINQDVGTLFNPNGYLDPLNTENTFDAANAGVIIPVNAIPGENELEVWWMRTNGVDTTAGFHAIYWPSVIGRYTIEWPTDPPEIILASNDGSGALTSLPATGSIYVQNIATEVGYNPNEEHAIMSGGQAFALRDDLNITETQNASSGDYSSEPFVLLEYTEADDRLAMIAFKVLREKPEDGITFSFDVDAGTILQGPMPLPLMAAPIPEDFVATAPSLNNEVGAALVRGAANSVTLEDVTLVLTELDTESSHGLTAFPSADVLNAVVLQDLNDRTITQNLYVTETPASDQLHGFVYEGLAGGGVTVPSFAQTNDQPAIVRFTFNDEIDADDFPQIDWANPTNEVVLASSSSNAFFVLEIEEITATYIDLKVPAAHYTSTEETVLYLRRTYDVDRLDFDDSLLAADAFLSPIDRGTEDFDGWRIGNTELQDLPTVFDASSDQDALEELYSGFTVQDRKGNLWVYRGPHTTDTTEASFAIRYHYKTIDGFWFPGLETQPEEGTITPYLRFANTNGTFAGSPDVLDDSDGDSTNTIDPQDSQALSITYRPQWPDDAPELHMAETLTLSTRGLSAVRGNSSLEIVYDQALVESATSSVVLHDPTRDKEYEFGITNTLADGSEHVLEGIPASVATTSYNGDTFFPELPPHLVERFFMDPNRGGSGALVFRGTFNEETVGENYVHLNVLTTSDTSELKKLTVDEDDDKAAWDDAIDLLAARVELFLEDTNAPGTFIAGDATDVLGTELVDIPDDDIAVDSYALTATGPGTGYVTLIAGNGFAFTATDDPVSMLVMKVVDTLHQGEIKIVQGSNPLGEKLTMQQVVDLAAKTDDYEFDWRTAAPADGLAPAVSEYQGAALLGSGGVWSHVAHPLPADSSGGLAAVDASRVESIGLGSLAPLSLIAYSSGAENDGADGYDFVASAAHLLATNNVVTITDANGISVDQQVVGVADSTSLSVTELAGQTVDESFEVGFSGDSAILLGEGREADKPQSYLRTEFTTAVDAIYTELWVSLDLDTNTMGAKVMINGEEVVIEGMNALDSTVTDSVASTASSVLSDENVLPSAYLVSSSVLKHGTLSDDNATLTHEVVLEVYATDTAAPGDAGDLDVAIHAVEWVDLVSSSTWLPDKLEVDATRAVIGGTADVAALSDQYVIMRYRPTVSTHASFLDYDGDGKSDVWSEWTDPQLAEGWIKRVLAGINPFNQRTTDLFNNAVDTDASMLTLAGKRWEGDVALNSDTIGDYGLIEIYETVLNRGRGLSIDSGINYGPANDALLLVAGYINDLYMFVGNEAQADALNPTIGIGTADGALGDVATALFAFKGQTATLLEEELALLRGRDDFLPPGVEANPVYNRMFWNYTRGIDSGEVIYALNYNIKEDNDSDFDGVINADDAATLYPQGHGDAYGHYLTAIKGYYSLLINPDFDWVPRTEGVTILGQTVQVDYTDERKFAAAAAAVAKTGKQVFDLTWRQDYQSGSTVGWEHFGAEAIRENSTRGTARHWGVDHWASRSGQGAYVNWVAGNAMLPEIDDDPSHEGIQLIDRTTVPELSEIADLGRELQTGMDSADAHLNPLGLADGSVVFDISPHGGLGTGGSTHFEQVYDRAKTALGNAVVAFDDAKGVTALMRSETDSLADFQASVDSQEIAFTNALIEIYGTPYADDIGVGETFATDYAGPDLVHYMYVDNNELTGPVVDPANDLTIKIDIQDYNEAFHTGTKRDQNYFDFIEKNIPYSDNAGYQKDIQYLEYTLDSHGFFSKPSDWTGRRESPGKLQGAISDIVKARNKANLAFRNQEALKYELDRMIEVWDAQKGEGGISSQITGYKEDILIAQSFLATAKYAASLFDLYTENSKTAAENWSASISGSLPRILVAGFSTGFDPAATADGAIKSARAAAVDTFNLAKFLRAAAFGSYEFGLNETIRFRNFYDIGPLEGQSARMDRIFDIDMKLGDVQMAMHQINQALQELADARSKYQKLLAEGNRIQSEREVFRRRTAALTQGYRTRDAAFRIFRDEKLERYNALFDLAARYSFLAAKAFDYETGLLHSDQGLEFIERIVGSRALGVVAGGEPQFAGSDSGDPGLSSALAEMAAEFQVLKGRLGLNNPDVYGTTVSLRTENHRIRPVVEGDSTADTNWRDVLEASRVANLLEDEDVVRHCTQIDLGNGLPVPGLLIEFSTEISDGRNLFGQLLAGGDHAFDVSAFATKIFSVGVVLEGYRGMDDPDSNAAATGGSSASDPTAAFLDSALLSATPHIYLIPVGLDAMRSPPLGDQSVVRTWSVEDVTIPLPFNIGGSDFSTKQLYQSTDSLSEDLFSVRKHQAFRPVSDVGVFGENPRLLPSIYTNNRLIGRSVWNTKWKLVIPGRTLLNNPDQGLDVLIDNLTDIKIHLETYSYSGN